MEREQTKNILVNILTAAIVLGVLVAGYIVFTKKDSAGTSSTQPAPSIAKIAEETSSIGVEIDATVRDLKDLSRAVASSTVIFDLPAFKNLQDFTVTISTEAIGRPNPFIVPDWKIKMKALEEATAKSAGGASGSTAVTTTTTTTTTSATGTQSQASTGLLGNFSTGI